MQEKEHPLHDVLCKGRLAYQHIVRTPKELTVQHIFTTEVGMQYISLSEIRLVNAQNTVRASCIYFSLDCSTLQKCFTYDDDVLPLIVF